MAYPDAAVGAVYLALEEMRGPKDAPAAAATVAKAPAGGATGQGPHPLLKTSQL